MSLVVQSHGGLGNQLFQAQYAHFIAEKIPELCVRFSSTHSRDSRQFHLDGFFENCLHVKQSKSRFQIESKKNLIVDGLSRRNMTFFNSLIKRLDENDSTEIENLRYLCKRGSKASIRGYFQNYIFEASECFDRQMNGAISKNSGQTNAEYKTVVHIRKGDYVEFRSHGPLANEYFEGIITDFKSGLTVLHTDAEKNQLTSKILNQADEIRLSTDNSPWSLLRDAVKAKIFIGSNSTLSWWAATINEKSNTAVKSKIIMPSEWKRESCDAQEKLMKPSWKSIQSIWES